MLGLSLTMKGHSLRYLEAMTEIQYSVTQLHTQHMNNAHRLTIYYNTAVMVEVHNDE